ncbi:MAG: sigma-70 domain-containing protein [Candidatus Bipolaricaulota bacterium]
MELLEELADELRRHPSPESRRRLTQAAVPLVEEVAQEFGASGRPRDALLRAGHLGLLNAVSNIDLDKRGDFATFARNLIRGEIRACIREGFPTPKPPSWLEALGERIDVAHRELAGELGRPPSLSELAGRLNLSEEGLREAFKAREAFRYTSLAQDQRSSDPQPDFHPEAVQDAAPTELPWPARARLAQALQRLQGLAERMLDQVFGGEKRDDN